MTSFQMHSIESAPGQSKSILEGVVKKYGFIPNSLAVMAEAPAMLDSYMTLSGIFEKSSLNEIERQIVLLANSNKNGCSYCVAAHTTIMQMAKIPDDVIESLRDDKPITDDKLEALHKFANIINKKRGWPSEEEVNAFLSAGYTKQTILEVIVGTSIKVLSNYTNHIGEPKVDDAFASNSWESN